ncbi:MAG: hypothetical protein ACRC8O_01450 [Plesiomonas shigelloides]
MNSVKKMFGLRQLSCLVLGCLPFTVYANASEYMTDTILFQGSVISPASAWAWQIDPGATSWARDWNINSQQGVKNGKFVTFSYTEGKGSRRWAFLQGFMKKPSAYGCSSIAPIVSITDRYNRRIILNGDTERQEVELKAIGDAGGVIGTMLISLESAYAVYYKKIDEHDVYYRTWLNDSAGIGFAALSVIIENQPKLYDYYPHSLRSIDVRQGIHYDMTSLLRGALIPSASDLLGGFTSHMSKVKTVWPSDHVPSTWQATLTVDVRMP